MKIEIEFLHTRAEALRRLALSAPDIADQLHRLADELDATADALERRGARPVC